MDNIISINKKVQISIGLKNKTKKYLDYPIIWYPQGIFVTMSVSLNHGVGGTTIQASFKDKMCLLNGEMGGVIQSSVQLDQYDTIDENGNWITKKVPLCQIISELVVHLGGESLDKVFIEDLDPRVKMVMKWTGNKPIYIGEKNNDSILTTNYSEASKEGRIVTAYQYEDDIGFIYTDFVYTEDLIADAGSNVCMQLDKIKNYLGNFEYFYDIYGNFHFQEIKNYLNNSQAKIVINNILADDYKIDLSQGKTVYTFDNSTLITSFQNNPQYQNIKNDFIVWGIKKNANGNDIPIRYHLAIDKKPIVQGYAPHGDSLSAPYYGIHNNICFYDEQDTNLHKAKKPIYFDTEEKLLSITGAEDNFYYAKDVMKIYTWKSGAMVELPNSVLKQVYSWDWRTELYLQGIEAEPQAVYTNPYYVELINEWPKLYNVEEGYFYPEVIERPSDIQYFLDFIDVGSAISEFNIGNIGRRSQVINDNNINCVFEPDIPPFILIETGQGQETIDKRNEAIAQGQKFLQVAPSIYNLLNTGGSLNSAYVKIRELLYQYTNYNEGITIQAIPLFYLEPNTRIEVRDEESDIYGDYMISTISIPLTINGTMSISATRALERF